MNSYELATSLVKNIITATEQSAVAIVRALKAHTFPVRVTNVPKVQDIKGTVVVGNQKNLERQLQKSDKTLASVLAAIRGIKIPGSFAVTNFPKPPEFPKPLSEITVKNFPPVPVFPKQFEITNQPITELRNIVLEGMELRKAVKGLKLAPVIHVDAPRPEKVVVPAPQVTVNEKEVDYEKLAEAVAKNIPRIDYEKLATALGKKLSESFISGGGGGGGGKYAFQTREGERTYGLVNALRQLSVVNEERWGLMNSAKVSGVTYTGEQDVDANWIIRKITKTGSSVSMEYATVKNNPTETTYASAWSNKATLTYDDFATAFAIT